MLPRIEQQREFARLLIDGFVERVLIPLRDDRSTGKVFDFVDLRGVLTTSHQWFDEMHPTGAGFAALATTFRQLLFLTTNQLRLTACFLFAAL